MVRILPAASLIVLLCLTPQSLFAMASTSDVLADGTVQATAAYGAVSGNDTGAMGTLLGLLNDDGIFDADVGNLTWQLSGKSDEADNGPFTGNPQSTAGTLTFDAPMDGIFVLSLKAANSYSAYLFDGSFEDVDYIDFITNGVTADGEDKVHDLSHASLFVPTSNPAVPEPTALCVWTGLILAIGLATSFRRRKAE